MKKVPLAQASRSLAKYAAELKDEIMVVTQGRRAVAALVPLKNVDRETLALSAHPGFLALVGKARAEISGGRVLSLPEMRARVLKRKRASHKSSQPTAPRRRGGKAPAR